MRKARPPETFFPSEVRVKDGGERASFFHDKVCLVGDWRVRLNETRLSSHKMMKDRDSPGILCSSCK